MLQQTQVSRVQARWGPFLARFPTPEACAQAPAAEVVRWWAGLGYNRRALYLHRCAVEVVARFGGAVPDTLNGLLSLPGVGAYTSRAVLAFAYGADLGVLDTNAARVLARAVAGRRMGGAEAQRVADAVVPAGQGWAWNQSILDLGATICTTSGPGCQRCPLAGGTCRWEAAGRPEPDPAAGSAGTSRPQSTFAGSDRQGRGRLVDALRRGPLDAGDGCLAAACGWAGDPGRARRIAQGLVADGLARWSGDESVLSLAGEAPAATL
ncbi:MAG TPA: A/G-specific adenine glycosylase, partial [Acidimicrobiia bacterium]|nr:A/G-specific adenine glycosylase [Acidimicrobiia bacterium]